MVNTWMDGHEHGHGPWNEVDTPGELYSCSNLVCADEASYAPGMLRYWHGDKLNAEGWYCENCMDECKYSYHREIGDRDDETDISDMVGPTLAEELEHRFHHRNVVDPDHSHARPAPPLSER